MGQQEWIFCVVNEGSRFLCDESMSKVDFETYFVIYFVLMIIIIIIIIITIINKYNLIHCRLYNIRYCPHYKLFFCLIKNILN